MIEYVKYNHAGISTQAVEPGEMIEHIDAIYEGGVFRPLSPLSLADREKVRLIVKSAHDDWLDEDAQRMAEREAEPELSLEEIRAELAKVSGVWAEDIIAERGEY